MTLNFSCPINSLSYGLVSSNLLLEMDKAGEDISLFPINEQTIEAEPRYHSTIKKGMARAQSFDVKSPALRLFHQFSLFPRFSSTFQAGFPIFELNKFTSLELTHLRSCDAVFVPSKWAKDVCDQYNIPNVDVVPLGVDQSIFKSLTVPAPKKTIFFNCGKFEIRKGHDVLPDIFSKAFTKQDNVELWLMPTNPFIQEKDRHAWENLYFNSPLGDKIKILPRVETQAQMAHLMNQVTCGIYPSRAEGWNLSVLELMACGKPSIVTNYSAHTEFCNKDNSYLIEIDSLEDAIDGQFFKSGGPVNQGQWASLKENQIEQCVNHMRDIYRNGIKTNSCLETAGNFTWLGSSQKLLQKLSHYANMNN
jgi:glycosyltransferase involved in cell wall biosynthesis